MIIKLDPELSDEEVLKTQKMDSLCCAGRYQEEIFKSFLKERTRELSLEGHSGQHGKHVEHRASQTDSLKPLGAPAEGRMAH